MTNRSLRIISSSALIEWGLGLAIVGHYLSASSLAVASLSSCLTALALLNRLDLRLRDLLTRSGERFLLDLDDLEELSHQLNLQAVIFPDPDLKSELMMSLPNPEKGDFEEGIMRLKATLSHPEQQSESLVTPLSPIEPPERVLELADHLEVRILPELPWVFGRPQLGIFARASIASGSVFLWRSDVRVRVFEAIKGKGSTQLDPLEEMNRRPLCRVPTFIDGDEWILEASQGSSRGQRSNALTWVNFEWCHTESLSAQRSPYRILPPHDLGVSNCQFASVIDPRVEPNTGVRLCSALILTREVREGQQLLAFTGSGRALFGVTLRRLISGGLSAMTPALIMLPWLRLLLR